MTKRIDEKIILDAFRVETLEHIQSTNTNLLKLQQNPKDADVQNELARSLHTIKGSSGMVGASEIRDLTHKLEDFLLAARDGTVILESSDYDILFKGMDFVDLLLKAFADGEKIEVNLPGLFHEIEDRMRRGVEGGAKAKAAAEAAAPPLPPPTPPPLPPAQPVQPLPPQAAAPLAAPEPPPKAQAKAVEPPAAPAAPKPPPKTEESIRVNIRKLDSLINTVGEMIINYIRNKEIHSQFKSFNSRLRNLNRQRMSLREYVDSFEERSTTGYRNIFMSLLSKYEKEYQDISQEINRIYGLHRESLDNMELIIRKLQTDVRDIRMLPISTILDFFPRAVYDLGKKYGKKVTLNVTGGHTELDKKVLEIIKDPLMHILRNSVDHGIERPEERVAAGKPETGQIVIAAYYEGDRVVIDINDDGKGINPAAVRQAAVRKGIITEDQAKGLTDREALYLIFKPGFSTRTEVSDVSGRGVGMDVVKKNIEENLTGEVRVESTPGVGMRLLLSLPLTLAAINALLLELSGQIFALPSLVIDHITRISPEEIYTLEGKEVTKIRDRLVPLIRLDEILGISPSPALTDLLSRSHGGGKKDRQKKIPTVIVNFSQQFLALIVDRFIGEQEIVIKPIREPFRKLKFIAGASLVGQGDVVIILHIPDIIEQVRFGEVGGFSRSSVGPVEVKDRKRILIVEDVLTTRELERSILQTAGYEVHSACNGLEAMKFIEEHDYQLILTDVQMPGMNGFELCRRVKENERFSHIPIIIVTGLESEEERRRGLNAGADAYLSKSSFDQSHLLEYVEEFISA